MWFAKSLNTKHQNRLILLKKFCIKLTTNNLCKFHTIIPLYAFLLTSYTCVENRKISPLKLVHGRHLASHQPQVSQQAMAIGRAAYVGQRSGPHNGALGQVRSMSRTADLHSSYLNDQHCDDMSFNNGMHHDGRYFLWFFRIFSAIDL